MPPLLAVIRLFFGHIPDVPELEDAKISLIEANINLKEPNINLMETSIKCI